MVPKLAPMTSRSVAGMIDWIMVHLCHEVAAERLGPSTVPMFLRRVAMATDRVVCVVSGRRVGGGGLVFHRGPPGIGYVEYRTLDLRLCFASDVARRLLPPAAVCPFIS